jgi:hypothetical protein
MNCPKCDHENSTEDSVKQVAECPLVVIMKAIYSNIYGLAVLVAIFLNCL